MAGIVFVYSPETVEVTLTRIVHVEPAAMEALFRVTVEPPLLALTVAELPQFNKEGETGLARITFAGRLSVSDVWVSAVSRSLFRIRIVSWLVCPTKIVFGEKLLLNVGALTRSTCRVALEGEVLVTVPPSPLEESAPGGIVLIKFPIVVEVTSIPTVQEPGVAVTSAGTVPPLSDRTVPPTGAETVPPHVFETLAGLAIRIPGCTPARLSVHEASVSSKTLGL